MKKRMKMKKKGFTFVEIMVAVAIIALLAVGFLPLINNMRINTNEAKAQQGLKTLADVLESYWTVNNNYPGSLESLTQGIAPYLDPSWLSAKSGYVYSIDSAKTNKYGYFLTASPVEGAGIHEFSLDHSGRIVLAMANDPGVIDPPDDTGEDEIISISPTKTTSPAIARTTAPPVTTTAPPCQPKTEYCPTLGRNITTYSCVNNQLVALEFCPPQETIDPPDDTEEIIALTCNGETIKCPDGTWIITKKCIGGKLFSTGATCPSDAITCPSTKPQICWDGSAITYTCVNGILIPSATCPPPTTTPPITTRPPTTTRPPDIIPGPAQTTTPPVLIPDDIIFD